MTMVLGPDQSVHDVVGPGNAGCPVCAGPLRLWGSARWRVVRGPDGPWRCRPSRVRCRRCGVTQVVLPADLLVRRRDTVAVIGRAWEGFATGKGPRRMAAELGVPMETVRGWRRRLLRRFGASGADRAVAARRLAGALRSTQAAAGGHGGGGVPSWPLVGFRCQGRLLCNTT